MSVILRTSWSFSFLSPCKHHLSLLGMNGFSLSFPTMSQIHSIMLLGTGHLLYPHWEWNGDTKGYRVAAGLKRQVGDQEVQLDTLQSTCKVWINSNFLPNTLTFHSAYSACCLSCFVPYCSFSEVSFSSLCLWTLRSWKAELVSPLTPSIRLA